MYLVSSESDVVGDIYLNVLQTYQHVRLANDAPTRVGLHGRASR